MLPPNYVRRSEWGARRPKAVASLLPSQVDGVVFHYTASNSDEQAGHSACAGRVRGIQNFHMDDPDRLWADIAYSLLACKHGWIFEGRGLERMSAATFGENDHTLAVCFLGDDTFGRDDLTHAGRQALVAATRYIRAARPLAQKLNGHRDFVNTPCPGEEIYSYIRSGVFRSQLAVRDEVRLAALRKWILAQHANGWGWKAIKASPNWREYVRLGGK